MGIGVTRLITRVRAGVDPRAVFVATCHPPGSASGVRAVLSAVVARGSDYYYFVTWVFSRIMEYEDDHPHTSGSRAAAARVGHVPRSVPCPFRPQRGSPRPGALLDRAADRVAQQELRHHRPKCPRHLRTATPRPAHHDGLGRGRPQPPARPAPAAIAQRGGRRPDLRRHWLRQAGHVLRGRGPPVLRHPGQGRQLPGHRQLPLRRTHPGLASRHPTVPAEGLGRRRVAAGQGPGAGGDRLPDQAADRSGPPGPGQGLGRALGLCDRRRGLRRQPQLPGRPGAAPPALRGCRPRRLRRGAVSARRGGAPGRCPDPGPSGAVVALGGLAGGEPGLDARPIRRVARLAGDVVGAAAGWLIGERASDGKCRYYWSNFGPAVALERLVEYAHRRHWVEQYHEEAKGLLGWDQYQGRLWQGFHRHAVSVMLAYSFLVWPEWQRRQERTRPGRPRRAFSPSAGSASVVAAGGPSPGLRLAPPRSGQRVAGA